MAGTSAQDPGSASKPEDEFRWQAWFGQSDDGVFVLNRQRRLIYANRAWEKATGLLLREVRGQACRRRPRRVLADKTELILGALAPPSEALEGRATQVRRLLPGIGREAHWVQVAYLPLGGGGALRGLVGVVKSTPGQPPAALLQPLPERLLTLRDRRRIALDGGADDDPQWTRVTEQARLTAARPGMPVLLVGPEGCGKLRLARAIHQNSSWNERFFACLECDRLPAAVIADTLWGQPTPAALGVVLLKEPHRLSTDLQDRLVAALESRENDGAATPWFMASLRCDPREEVRAGRLLESLYCRLSVVTITLPPLAQRRGQLPEFVAETLRRLADGPAPSGVSAATLELLRGHDWPGNFHELQRVLAEAVERAAGGTIEPVHVPHYLKGAPAPRERSFPLDALLEKVERRLIAIALRLAGDNKTKASELLGIWRARLIRRLETLGIGATAPREGPATDSPQSP